MPEQEEANEPHGRGSKLALITTAAVVLPLLYVLSIGPVALVLNKTHDFGGLISEKPLEAFYAPVVWLAMNTPLRRPLDAYMRFWTGL
jgi:hypothetical protein